MFQSTPPVAGGRCAGQRQGDAVPRRVSIHAPRCRGAMPGSKRHKNNCHSGFQSTPPVAGGRCKTRRLILTPKKQFQSTPPVAGGRCSAHVKALACQICFNPRPPLPGGDASARSSSQCGIFCSFNPRPPLPGGDAGGMGAADQGHGVSIHAPRCRGAMQAVWEPLTKAMEFQSTPPVAGGRCLLRRNSVHRYGPVSIHAPRCRGAMQRFHFFRRQVHFVSIHAPRCRGAMHLLTWMSLPAMACFNPRPPLPGGDALDLVRVSKEFSVSIHAPRCRGAMHRSHTPVSRLDPMFQSTPPVPGGDACTRITCHPNPYCFNPRPPLPGGDARAYAAA